MLIQPSSFVPMVSQAASVEAVNHIYDSVDHLFGFEYSPSVYSDKEWAMLQSARDARIEELTE